MVPYKIISVTDDTLYDSAVIFKQTGIEVNPEATYTISISRRDRVVLKLYLDGNVQNPCEKIEVKGWELFRVTASTWKMS